MSAYDLDVTATAKPEEIAAIGDGLAGFNAADVGPSGREALCVLIREDGRVTGGLYGYTAWGWLYIQWLFVPETLRGQGLAGKLLAAAETEAIRRGCQAAWIDTFNAKALQAYKRQGYAVFGALEGFPADLERTRWFLQKRLTG